MSGPLVILRRYPDFRHLFLAELIMFGGDWFVMIPLLVLLPDLTGSGLWGGLVLATDTGVNAALLPFAGIVADRFDRRRVMLTTNLISIAAAATLLLVRSHATAWIALAAIAVISAAKAFYTPAAAAALPNLVDPEDLPTANAVAGSSWGTMLVAGASLGGVVAGLVGPYPCFVVDAGCMALAALLQARIRRPTRSAGESAGRHRKPLAAVVEAIRYVRSQPRVAALVTVKPAVGVGNGVVAVFPLLAAVVFGMGPLGTGLLFAARGLGALIGPFLLRGLYTRRDWLLPVAGLSMVMYGLAYLGVAAAPWFAVAVPMVVVAHVAGGANWTLSNVALQTEVPDALRGRVFATDMMIVTLAVALSQLGAGALVDLVNGRVVVAACGAATLGYTVIWRLAIRGIDRAPSDSTEPSGGDLGGVV